MSRTSTCPSTTALLAGESAFMPSNQGLSNRRGRSGQAVDMLWDFTIRSREASASMITLLLLLACHDEDKCIYHWDADGDGYYASAETCAPPDGVDARPGPVEGVADCDDADPAIHPDANDGEQRCDGLDNDCDEDVDEDQTAGWFHDSDGDGYGDASGPEVGGCEADSGSVQDGTDCDDSDANVYPGARDVCSDGVKTNCNAENDECGLFGEVALADLDTLHFGGTSAVALGDLDGDGYDDVAIGDGLHDAVYLIRGGPTGMHLGAETVEGEPESAFGAAVLFDDYDGDGAGDLVVGAPSANEGKGAIILRYGPDWLEETSIVPHFDDALNLGLRLEASSCTESPSIVATVLAASSEYLPIYSYFVVIDSPSTAEATSAAWVFGPYLALDAWPIAISTDSDVPAISVGLSDKSFHWSGAGAFDCPISDDDYLDISVISDLDGTPTSFGASVIYNQLASDDLLLVAGAPEASVAYGFLNLSATQVDYFDSDLTWTGSGAGASAAVVADLDGDGDTELAIGGQGHLWILRQGNDGVADGELDTVADGVISGFNGFVTDILGAGDVNGDGFEDLLVIDDDSVWLLYGGPTS